MAYSVRDVFDFRGTAHRQDISCGVSLRWQEPESGQDILDRRLFLCSRFDFSKQHVTADEKQIQKTVFCFCCKDEFFFFKWDSSRCGTTQGASF